VHVSRFAVAVFSAGHEHGVHAVAPGASHSEASVVRGVMRRVHQDRGVVALEPGRRARGVALRDAHVAGARHGVRGKGVVRVSLDARQGQRAGAVISTRVLFHRDVLVRAAGVLQGLGFGVYGVSERVNDPSAEKKISGRGG